MSFKGKRPSIMFPLFMVIKHRFNEHFMVDPPSLRGHQPLCQRVGSPLNKHRWFWWQKCWDCSPNKKLGMFNQEKRDLTYLIWSNHDTNRKKQRAKMRTCWTQKTGFDQGQSGYTMGTLTFPNFNFNATNGSQKNIADWWFHLIIIFFYCSHGH